MAHPILMPKPGQMTEECSIIAWRKKEGEKVAKGDVLFEIETDKSNMEVESFHAGTLLKIAVTEGQTVPVQSVVGYIGQPGEAVPATPPPPPKAVSAPSAAAPTARAAAGPRPSAPVAAAPLAVAQASCLPPDRLEACPTVAPARFVISPRARALARECAIDPRPIPGTGPDGRVTEKDVRDYLDGRGYERLVISPAAKELAVKEGVDILGVRGSGERGRISVADIQRALAERPKPMSRMRQTIAQRLTHSFTTTPHFFATVSVDMTDLLAYRAELKKRGAPYTVTDFILHAVAAALKEFPTVNSTTDGRQVWWHGQVHLGLAVALEQGLVVPVIWAAETLSLDELHERNAVLSEKARAGKLQPAEMTGSTFTVSNMGMLNVEEFTAIINPGEGAILAVASTMPQAVAKDGQVVVRQMMKITLSSDHRLVDGATAARFVNAVKQKLEDVEHWRGLAG